MDKDQAQLVEDIELLSTYITDGYTKAVLKRAAETIRQLAADVAPVRHGQWKGEHKSGYLSHPYSITYECSECGYSVYTVLGSPQLSSYCPNCGAKMDGEE